MSAAVPLLSSRSKSGYKYVIYDSRASARLKPWSASYRRYRSAGFATAHECALHIAAKIANDDVKHSRKKTKKSSAQKYVPEMWMHKAGVHFMTSACDLFGKRIMMTHKNKEKLAVIKCWMPCAVAGFGVVFDEMPDKVFMEDLLRPGRKDWRVVPWEDDEWQTQDLRPMCPQCGHPMRDGQAAWTKCMPCGQMEPGVASTGMFSRVRSDPYRSA